MGVCTRTTPSASFSINIRWDHLEPEINQSNSRAAIIALKYTHAKPYFAESKPILLNHPKLLGRPANHSGYFYAEGGANFSTGKPWLGRARLRLRGGCPCGGSGPPRQIRCPRLRPGLSLPGSRPSTSHLT